MLSNFLIRWWHW